MKALGCTAQPLRPSAATMAVKLAEAYREIVWAPMLPVVQVS